MFQLHYIELISDIGYLIGLCQVLPVGECGCLLFDVCEVERVESAELNKQTSRHHKKRHISSASKRPFKFPAGSKNEERLSVTS